MSRRSFNTIFNKNNSYPKKKYNISEQNLKILNKVDSLKKLKEKGFEILTLHHADAILKYDMSLAMKEIEEALLSIYITVEELIYGGGGEGLLTQRLRKKFSDELGWKKHNFEMKKIIDGVEIESQTHEVDHVKKFNGFTIALEIEWNNKDPFYDRDLENFKRLHATGAISIGVIITRGQSLQENLINLVEGFAFSKGIKNVETLKQYYTPTPRQIKLIEKAKKTKKSFEKGWATQFVSDKFVKSSTHWVKLEDRVRRGVGNPCPLLLIGIPKEVVRK